jgi:hypothetical protein
VADIDKQVELREKGAEFIAVREALARVAQLPVVRASAVERARVDALSGRAAKLQSLIEQVGRMIDGARHWFKDTFSTDVSENVPLANTAINGAMQSAIASMNYFIRDAKKELAQIEQAQKVFEGASDEQKKLMLGDLSAQTLPAAAAPSKKTALIVLAVVGVLIWLGRDQDVVDTSREYR